MSAAPPCQHPPSAQFFDRVRGQTSCTLCGEVLSDQHFELDPAFARGERGGGGGGGGGGSRAPGFSRPTRPQHSLGSHGLHRPSVEAARRQLIAIARKLSIPPAHIDIAAGVFKQAVTANAVVGARSAVLCACLYIVCRRQPESTPLTVLDFAETTGDSPFSITAYMRTICKATHTTLPPTEPVFLVVRLANHLDLGDASDDIAVYGMKVMRAMRNDWIETGRRPLGVAAAALVVACQVFGVDLDMDHLASVVRLHKFTIVNRVEEFAATPTAALSNIDEYDPEHESQSTKPMAYLRGRKDEADYVLADEMRGIANLFYELVNEAREHAPPTAERQAKWTRFIAAKSASSGIPEASLPGDLSQLTHAQQLEQLGAVSRRFKREQTSSVKSEPPRTQDEAAVLAESIAKARALAESTSGHAIQQAADAAVAAAAAAATAPAADVSSGGASLGTVVSATGPLPRTPAVVHNIDGRAAYEVELELSDASDVEDEYVIYDNEARLRIEAANRAAFKDEWDRVGTRVANALARHQQNQARADGTTEDIDDAPHGRGKRERPAPAASALESLRRALRNRGGGNINLDNLEALIPGVSSTDAIDFDELLGDSSTGAGGTDAFNTDEWLVE